METVDKEMVPQVGGGVLTILLGGCVMGSALGCDCAGWDSGGGGWALGRGGVLCCWGWGCGVWCTGSRAVLWTTLLKPASCLILSFKPIRRRAS